MNADVFFETGILGFMQADSSSIPALSSKLLRCWVTISR